MEIFCNIASKYENVGGFNPKTVKIGNQAWMAENLGIDDGEYGIYHHDGETYYDWDAAIRVCSKLKGWRVPSKADFESLLNAAGGAEIAGISLKSTHGWASNGNGKDVLGFSALPAGLWSDISDIVTYVGWDAFFWSSTEFDGRSAYGMSVHAGNDFGRLFAAVGNKGAGFSVRLIKA